MHTNENQNKKDTTVRMGKPGEQVAVNRTMHNNMVLHENESGEYYPVCQRIETPSLIRSEYIPIGSRLQYPNKWGRKRAATHLLEFKIADAKKQIADAQTELEKLERCLSAVQGWDDDSKE